MNPLHPLLVTLTSLLATARARVRDRAGGRGDDGLTTLEVAVIALGLLLIAAVLVLAINTAVRNRTNQIT